MAFRARHRKAEHGEVELLRGLIRLANQLQSSLELDAIVHVIATALSETFGFREAAVYLAEPSGESFRACATVGEYPEYDAQLYERPIPRRIWDELFLERYQIGSSYFVDHRQHQWTKEQLYYLPEIDLGDRSEGQWHRDDALYVPLFDKRRELMGVLDLYDPADRALPTLELVKSLEVFATHAAVAIENARQYEQLELASRELEGQLGLRHSLLDLSAAMLGTLSEREVFNQIADKLKRIVDYDTMDIRLVDDIAGELVTIYARDESAEEMLAFRNSIDEGVSGWVVRHNEAQLVNDMVHDPRGVLVPGTEAEPQASIIVPLNVGGTVTGVLAIDRLGGKTFEEQELEPAKLFANLAAIAIQNARQYDDLQRATTRLEAQVGLQEQLIGVSTALLSSLDQREVFSQITTMLKEIVDYDAMDIRLVDEETRELVCIYSRDTNAEEMLTFRGSIDEGVSGWVVRHNQAQLVNDMLHDPRIVQVPGTEEDEQQASIIVPLTVQGRVTGVLCLDRMDGRTFEEHELEPVKLFGNLAAIAIQNARTYEEMERQAISDGLTGIHNYRHFHDTLQSLVSRAERYEESFCLLMMDLDHFKAVNDTVGHQKGDDVLRAVADAMRSCSRESDYLARYGGEEFVMILPRTGLAEARTLAERIRQAVAAIDIGHDGLRVTTSIGVASYPESARDSDGVLGAADAALLRAKARGRDRVCLFSEELTGAATQLEGDLVALGRRFADFIGLSVEEAAGLITALAVYESGGTLQDEVQVILGRGGNGGDSEAETVRQQAVSALVYGNERWDGSGYPEGRRGAAIPRVARAFAVCRGFNVAAHNGDSVDELRSRASTELDPRMVQRFTAMLRAEKAEQN